METETIQTEQTGAEEQTQDLQDFDTFTEPRDVEDMVLSSMTQPSEDMEQPEDSNLGASTDEDGEQPEGSDTNNDTDDQSITADGEDVATKPEEKADAAKWSEEDLKLFESKGWKDVPFSESTSNLLNSYRELEKAKTQDSQVIGSRNATLAHIFNTMQAGDVNGLKEIAEHVGAKLDIDTRTPEDRISELQSSYNEVYDTFSPVLDHVLKEAQNIASENPQLAQYLNNLASAIDGRLNNLSSEKKKAIDEIKFDMKLDQRVNSKMGLKSSASPYESLQAQAENAFAEFRKTDPNADKAINKVTEIFGKGSPFEAAGINIAKMVGTSPDMAILTLKMGKAMDVLEKLESGALEKEIYQKFTKEQNSRIEPSINGSLNPNLETHELSAWDKQRAELYND